MPGSELAHMKQWLSKRVGEPLQVPDLQSIGLKLVGGRLLPGPTGAAAFYMYEGPSGERYTIYCAKAGGPETALRFKNGERDASFTWVDDKVGYVVSGPADRERLEAVTKTVYEQVDKGAREEKLSQILPRIIRLVVAQLFHQFLELVARVLGQHHAHGGEQIAGRTFAPPLTFRPLPLRRNVRPELVSAGIASSTAPSSVGTRTLPPSTAS